VSPSGEFNNSRNETSTSNYGKIRPPHRSILCRNFSEPFPIAARTSTSMTAIQEPPERAGEPASETGCRVPNPLPTHTFDFASLVQQHQAGVWRYVRFLGADWAEADDLTQETFLAVARAAFVERDERQTAGYLRVVARNQLLALRRKQGREIGTVELEAADGVWAAAAGTDGSLTGYLAALTDCLTELEGRAREAVEMHYRENASREAIAERLEMRPDGVKTLLRRIRQVLRECVERKVRIETKS
jgi:RNA polymerase sigma-70 factor (ECF subfamily)